MTFQVSKNAIFNITINYQFIFFAVETEFYLKKILLNILQYKKSGKQEQDK